MCSKELLKESNRVQMSHLVKGRVRIIREDLLSGAISGEIYGGNLGQYSGADF